MTAVRRERVRASDGVRFVVIWRCEKHPTDHEFIQYADDTRVFDKPGNEMDWNQKNALDAGNCPHCVE